MVVTWIGDPCKIHAKLQNDVGTRPMDWRFQKSAKLSHDKSRRERRPCSKTTRSSTNLSRRSNTIR